MESTDIERALLRATLRLDGAIDACAQNGRRDLKGLPPSAAALLASRLAKATQRKLLILTSDNETAERFASDLRFFHHDVDDLALVYPSHDQSPFVDVAPDRRSAMERLSTLFHLAQALPWRFLALPLASLARRVPPRQALLSRSMVIQAEEELDRDALIQTLDESGYLRVPVVEDPGTFAVRGGLIDIFPPRQTRPCRIELDDWLVLSIRLFDPETQRTLEEVPQLFVHPARDTLYGAQELQLAQEKLRALCDHHNIPTRTTNALIDEVEAGRLYLGLDGFLPAFYPELESLFDYLPPDLLVLWLNPIDSSKALQHALEEADTDRAAKIQQGGAAFERDALFLSETQIAQTLDVADRTLIHQIVVGGTPDPDEGALAHSYHTAVEKVADLAFETQSNLVAELKQRRATHGRDDALRPLADITDTWLLQGFRVFFTARTPTQAQRLVSLLRDYNVPVASTPCPLTPALMHAKPSGEAQVIVGQLSAGFTMGTEALIFVTEEEIFGARSRRRRKKRSGRSARDRGRAFIEDLRQLSPGDFVVHSDHGVGRYLGIEHKSLQLSRNDEMHGVPTVKVEVLIIEYANADKLFLPVTRLHQLQKYSGGERKSAKLDRLGGQTFGKTKSRVKKKVRQMAEELLKLYAERLAHERPALEPSDRTYSEFEATFPFEETADQATAIEDVLGDLESPRPMDRIVCGDVGFGKTEVAIRAAFRVAMSGRQVAILCPTTVLAQQHYNTFAARLDDYPLRVEVLSRFVDRKTQSTVLAATKEGKVDVLIGTHRLLSKDIHFADLGLLVVDEEQRFGVTHKERIKKLRSTVDVLTLTATPIPRTLQLAIGGLRDLSLITTPPVDRRAVRTIVTRWDDHMMREAIQRELSRGGQAFFVYNRIEGLYERARKLQQMLPQARFAVAHGQMGERELERTMTDFVDGAYDVLCSTAIIESGLDIPRANTILIDRADNFGLAQLYQLRGRVGRSKERAYCYLLTPPASKMTDDARARIETLERFSHLGAGFSVASHDMELRGAGDVLGGEQSGSLAAVGFDLFLHMLQEAVAELKGQPIVPDVDTELTLDIEQYLPEKYVEDVGLRLALYKRFGSARDEEEVIELASEMEERFGPAPPPAVQLVRAMRLRPQLRDLRVLGCEAHRRRITLHLRADTRLDPAQIMQRVTQTRNLWKLTPDMKLTRRFQEDDDRDSLVKLRELLKELSGIQLPTPTS